ncbi:hypothetical protein pEaSNUABM37_00273 [Erwinia phage pEa_SNUABM_37]|nr:hypothetical protein pEaSNUABM37_00273 [Erwinia phage pEa_SNUABM_37]QXO10741.1 hypothetical protein pEaSNUABM48_00273 [Erwinia phage pEa_SNUABM_48]
MTAEMSQFDINKMHHETGSRAEEKIARAFQGYQNPQIQEHVFTSLFLPMFVGGGPFMNVDAWRGYAGSLNNEVDVFRGTEYLYTIPPIQLETRSVISQRSEGGGQGSTLNGALINRVHNPADPEIFQLVNSQVAQAEDMVIDKSAEYMVRWDEIFQRYGIDYKEVRKEVGRIRFGIDVKDDINDPSSKKNQDEEIEFGDSGDFTY